MINGRRSNLSNTQNRNMTNLTPRTSSRVSPPAACQNHPSKTATHSLISQELPDELLYCQKCSIMLASQGFNVTKLSCASSQPKVFTRQPAKNPRQLQVQRFIQEINHQIQTIRQQGLNVQNSIKISEENYGRIMTQITHFFQQIQTMVEIQKFMAYNRVLTERAENQAQLWEIRQALSVELESLSGIICDIQNNMEAVETVEAEVYQTIMENYRNKLEVSYESCSTAIPPLEEVCIGYLPEIPKELSSLGDRIQLRTQIMEPTPSSKQMESGHPSVNSSRVVAHKRFDMNPPSNSLPSSTSIRRRESSDSSQNYSFDQSSGYNRSSLNPRILFKDQNRLLPNEVPFRQSLNLTEIRYNYESMGLRRFPHFEQTIPEEIQSSRQSIEGYLKSSVERQGEDTETLLIC